MSAEEELAGELTDLAGWAGHSVAVYGPLDGAVTSGNGEQKFIVYSDGRMLALAFGWGAGGPHVDMRAYDTDTGEMLELDLIAVPGDGPLDPPVLSIFTKRPERDAGPSN